MYVCICIIKFFFTLTNKILGSGAICCDSLHFSVLSDDEIINDRNIIKLYLHLSLVNSSISSSPLKAILKSE